MKLPDGNAWRNPHHRGTENFLEKSPEVGKWKLTQITFPRTLRAMPTDATFESFEKELNRLVESFGKRLAELKSTDYNEAKLRDDFLNPFFRALGWDMENRAGLTDQQIDALVYELYNLTPEEIKLVEGHQ